MKAPLTPTRRSIRTVFALWLAFVLTQPVAVHACAMRNGTLMAAPAATEHAGHTMAGATDAMASMMRHDASSPTGETTQHCHCFGECAASAAFALIPPRTAVPAPPSVLAETREFLAVEHSVEAPDYLRPPATAPPTTSATA
jgi:hypothetical protein